MAEHEDETLRCIYCQRTISYPRAQVWPSACLHCGRWPGAYTVDQTPRRERRDA